MLVYLLAEGRYRLSRTIGSIAGVALGVALFTALVAAGDGFVTAARQPLAEVGADIVISRPDVMGEAAAQTTRGVRQPFGLVPLSFAELDQLSRLSSVADVSGGLLLWDFSANSYQTLLGVDVDAIPAQLAASVAQGRLFARDDAGVVVVDQHYAAFFSMKPGATVDIGGSSFEVIGIVAAAGGNQTATANFYLPLVDAQALAGLDGDQVNQIYMRVEAAADVESVIALVEAQLGEVSATTQQSIVAVMGGITEVSDRFASIAALAALLGGLLLTSVTLHAAISMRAREVGVMKATGWRARDVVRLFTIEGVAHTALGAVVGIALGWLTILAFAQIPIELPAVSDTTPDLAEVAPAVPLTIAASLSWGAVLVATATVVMGGGLVSFLSARRISRLQPADALRT